jgi:hypothetical protein
VLGDAVLDRAANLIVHVTIEKRGARDRGDDHHEQSPLEAEPADVDYSRNNDKKPSMVLCCRVRNSVRAWYPYTLTCRLSQMPHFKDRPKKGAGAFIGIDG